MPIIRIAWEGKGVGREADDVIDTPDKLSFQCSWQGKQSEFSYHILEKLSRKKQKDMNLTEFYCYLNLHENVKR